MGVVFIKRAINRGHFCVDRSRGTRRIGTEYYTYLIHEHNHRENGWHRTADTASVLLSGLDMAAFAA